MAAPEIWNLIEEATNLEGTSKELAPSGELSRPDPVCPDCRVEMEKGWHPFSANPYTGWQRGEPKLNWLGGISLHNIPRGILITSWRCPQCGLLRNYAIDKPSKNWRKVD